MNKCEFCKKEIEFGRLRCEDCDKVWENGVEFGKEVIRAKLRDYYDGLTRLVENDAKDEGGEQDEH